MSDAVLAIDNTPLHAGWSYRKTVGLTAVYALLLLAVVIILFPVFWMFSSSFKGPTELFARDMTLLPNVWSWENYANVWFNTPFPTYFWNSFYIAVVTTILSVAVSIYASYAIARIQFRGRFAFGMLLLVTQMFPHIMLVLPLFMIIRSLGLFNTHAALIIAYTAFSLPFSVWMLRSFFAAIPAELEDAAAIDGASLLGTLHRDVHVHPVVERVPVRTGVSAVPVVADAASWACQFPGGIQLPLGPADGWILDRVAAGPVVLPFDAALHRPGSAWRRGQRLTRSLQPYF